MQGVLVLATAKNRRPRSFNDGILALDRRRNNAFFAWIVGGRSLKRRLCRIDPPLGTEIRCLDQRMCSARFGPVFRSPLGTMKLP